MKSSKKYCSRLRRREPQFLKTGETLPPTGRHSRNQIGKPGLTTENAEFAEIFYFKVSFSESSAVARKNRRPPFDQAQDERLNA
jgi:hypothetical protein